MIATLFGTTLAHLNRRGALALRLKLQVVATKFNGMLREQARQLELSRLITCLGAIG
jgi:hypothetical protein